MRSRSAMWAEALELLQSAERLQRQFFQVGESTGGPCWEPPVDLYESGDELTLLVALPGVSAQQLEVILETASIFVRGERTLPFRSHQAAIHRLEIPYGRFERRIGLPEGRFQLLERRLENGCLALALRRLA